MRKITLKQANVGSKFKKQINNQLFRGTLLILCLLWTMLIQDFHSKMHKHECHNKTMHFL